MSSKTLMKYHSILMLKDALENDIEELEKRIKSYANELGEKIRVNQDQDDPELVEIKSKLTGMFEDPKETEKTIKDDKKTAKDEKKPAKSDKKPAKKTGKDKTNSNWYNLEGVLIYNGLSLQGELEIYFKGIEEMKEILAAKKKNLKMLENLINKGLKEDMGCVAYQSKEGILQISFLKTLIIRDDFSFNGVLTGNAVNLENPIEIYLK